MSILTPVTKLGVLGAAAGIIYATTSAVMPQHAPAAIEQGYVNPAHVELYTPKNENGKVELYLKYGNGQQEKSLPILLGPNGPVVGSAEYNWNSVGAEARAGFAEQEWENLEAPVKSRLVAESWNEIDAAVRSSLVQQGWSWLDTNAKSELVSGSWTEMPLEFRKNILKSELEKMIENYGRGN